MIDPERPPSRVRPGLLALLLAALVALPLATRPAWSEDPPAGKDDTGAKDGTKDGDGTSPEEQAAEARRLRQELEQRKHDLPKEARPALEILEKFRGQPLRLWMVPRQRMLEQGKPAVPALILFLEETDWEVRAFAAMCLGELNPPDALEPLIKALGKEAFVEARRQMVKAVAAQQNLKTQGILVEAAKDVDTGIRLAAVRGLGALRVEGAAPELRKYIQDPDLDVRYEALGSLGALGDKQARDRLHSEAQALVKTRDLQRYPSLEPMDIRDRYAQYLLGVALARIGDEATDKLLRDVLQGEKPWHNKVFLQLGSAEGLGRRAAAGGTLHPELEKGLRHDDANVRVACSYGLGFVGATELLRSLKRALADSQLEVRMNIVRALGNMDTQDAAEALHKALRDRTPEVRAAAARALGDATTPAATEGLLLALKDKKYVIRVLAARGLASRTAEPNVVRDLIRALKDPDFGVRAQAVASLSRAHTALDTVLPAIMDAIDDRDEGVRANVCLGVSALLERLDDPPPLDELFVQKVVKLALESPVERVERAAVELLDGQRPAAAMPPLLQALASNKEEERKRAISLIRKMSEKILDFDAAASRSKREEEARSWQSWWESNGVLPKRDRFAGMVLTGSLSEQTRDLKYRGLDLVLMLDSTGSMAGLLRSAKQSIDEIIREMSSPLPSLRISLFTYRDFGDNYVYYGTPLTFDMEHLPGFLQSFVHAQGGDIPEAVHQSVKAAMRDLAWRPDAHKVIIFAGDAPHHPELDREFRSDIRKWATKDNRAVLHALFTDTNRRSMDINRRKEREHPEDFNHPYFELYKSIAEEGRGRGVLLSDESALIKEILVLAFGPAWRADIENFLDFRN